MWRKKPIKRSDTEFEFDCQETLEPGCGKRRHCDSCNETVWDTTKMTRAEYEALPPTACVMATFDDEVMVFVAEPTSIRRSLVSLAVAGIMVLPLAGGCDSIGLPPAQLHYVEEPARADALSVEGASTAPVQSNRVLAFEPETRERPDPPDNLPEELTASERRLAYRLKTEYGIDIEGHEDQVGRPRYRPPTTLESAITDLEVLQRQRDIRNGSSSQPIQKRTLREALEEIEVLQNPHMMGRRKVRRVRTKGKPAFHNGLEIIRNENK